MTDFKFFGLKDIPFHNIIIHQPSLRELCLIFDSEEEIITAAKLFCCGTDFLKIQGKNNDKQLTDFNVLVGMMIDQSEKSIQLKKILFKLLYLILPKYDIKVNDINTILIEKDEKLFLLNSETYQQFSAIVYNIFKLDYFSGTNGGSKGINPNSPMARRIQEELAKRKQKLDKLSGKKYEGKKATTCLFEKQCSILIADLGFTWEEIMDFTVYQLFDSYKRSDMHENHDRYIQFRIAGAKDMQAIPYWKKSFDEVDKEERLNVKEK